MSSTKIVIDKEDWDKIASEFNSNDLPTVTEIQIDQSIEDEILYKNFFAITPQPSKEADLNGLKFESWDKDWTESLAKKCVQIAKDFATAQQIIEQLRVKEKIVLDDNLKIKEKTTVLMEGTYYPNDGFWINGIKVFPDYYTIR